MAEVAAHMASLGQFDSVTEEKFFRCKERLAALLRGEDEVRRIQLILEYNPAPPFNAGSPEGAGERITGAYFQADSGLLEERRRVIARIKARRESRRA